MANQRLNAIITIGGTVTGGLKSALGSTQTKLRAIGGTIRDLEREQKGLGRAIRDADGMPIYHLQRRYDALTGRIERARREQEKFKRAMETRNAGRGMMGEALGTIATVGAVAATAGLPIVHAASFEKAMLGVAKQVDGARDSSGKLTQVYHDMRREIQLLGREVPISTNELAGMVEQGARMGIARDGLIDFTRTTAKMATALDLPREELADNMGKIANLYGVPVPEIEKLGDAINYLDDNALSKGGDIVDFLRRTGGAAGLVKVSATEMAALGSTLLSLGERSETASTASNAFIQKLAAADKGTKKFRGALDEIGLSAAAVQKGMQTDTQGTILQVIEAVRKLPKEKQLGVLVDLVGLEHSDSISKLVSGVDEYRKQIDLVNSDKAGGSMGREFAAQLETTSAQFEILKNRAYETSVNIGAVLLPTVNKAMTVIGGIASATADWSREHPVLAKNIMAVTGAVVGGVVALNSLKFAFGAAQAAGATLKLMMATNPIGLAAIAIGAAALLIYQNWDAISAFFSNLWAGIKTTAGEAWTFLKDLFFKFHPLGIVITNWEPLTKYFGNLWGGLKSSAAGFIDWIMDKLAVVGDLARGVRGFFGGGDDAKPAKAGAGLPARRTPPPVPASAWTRAGAGNATTNNNTFHIKQQPGQDGKALAREVMKEMDARDRKRRGGALYDKAAG
ncbi:phage tail tape measure protein [Croceicoccus bisphenolivorans]|uniref:phage tail tape measure protein n=1 Tax=Croceicoccus bisphenolivorans TaxID=1783232 RepID=UPI0008355A6B|nr:phage tail tape measure protein [Croceicoccus bisphenolivorans]